MTPKLFRLPLLALLIGTFGTCGSDITSYSGNGGAFLAQGGRVRHIKGALPSPAQLKTQNDSSASLLSERWFPVDTDGAPIEGGSLLLVPLANRYRFFLEIPDPDFPPDTIRVMGETSPSQKPGDPTLRGQVLSPPECSASRVFIGALATGEKGAYLPVRVAGECRAFPFDLSGPFDGEWKFQSGTTLKSRVK